MNSLKRIVLAIASLGLGVQLVGGIFLDSVGDIDPAISTGGGTLDIVSMEVVNTATDVNFKLTVGGNLSTIDWGKFMIGISSGAPGDSAGNGWGRPITMNSPAGGMDYWIGSWVDGGGGAQLWSYEGGAWTGPSSPSSFSFTSGASSEINVGVSLVSLGLAAGDSIYFDAYSSGGGVSDSAVDALANPNISISSWSESYESSSGKGIQVYTVAVPELSSFGVVAGALLAFAVMRRRR